MTIPARIDDTDMLFRELLRRYKQMKVVKKERDELKEENSRLKEKINGLIVERDMGSDNVITMSKEIYDMFCKEDREKDEVIQKLMADEEYARAQWSKARRSRDNHRRILDELEKEKNTIEEERDYILSQLSDVLGRINIKIKG